MAQPKTPSNARCVLLAALIVSSVIFGAVFGAPFGAFFGVAFGASASEAVPGVRPSAPLDRPVRLDLWGVGLGEAVREIRNQTGVEILIFPPDLPPEETGGGLYLVTGDVPLGVALECLARRYGFRYRVSGAGKIELSRSYGWVGNDPALRFLRLDAFLPQNVETAEARAFLGEFLKPLPLTPGEFSLLMERVPAPGGKTFLRAVAVLPPAMADWLERAVRCLGGEAGDWPPPAQPQPLRPQAGQSSGQPSGQQAGQSAEQQPVRLFARARQSGTDWEAVLSRQVAFSRSGDLRTELAALCSQAGIAILLQSSGTGQLPPAGLPEGRIGLGRASEELSKRIGLERRTFLAPGAIVFESGPGAPWEMDERSRELFWSGQAVAGFDVRAAAERSGGGDALTARLKREVFPALWRDPATAAVYCRENGRLILVAPLNVLEAAAAWLEKVNAPLGGGREIAPKGK